MPVYLIVRRGDVHIHLSEHLGDARPGGLAYLWVDDVATAEGEWGWLLAACGWQREVEIVVGD